MANEHYLKIITDDDDDGASTKWCHCAFIHSNIILMAMRLWNVRPSLSKCARIMMIIINRRRVCSRGLRSSITLFTFRCKIYSKFKDMDMEFESVMPKTGKIRRKCMEKFFANFSCKYDQSDDGANVLQNVKCDKWIRHLNGTEFACENGMEKRMERSQNIYRMSTLTQHE